MVTSFWNEFKKNKYQKFSKITESKFRRLLRLFALDLTASDTAKLTGVSIRSVNSLYLKLRRGLADECGRQAPLYGIVELDESYFGAKRIRGKRGRGCVLPNISGYIMMTMSLSVVRGILTVLNFWSYAKHRLVQFNGVPKHTFYLY